MCYEISLSLGFVAIGIWLCDLLCYAAHNNYAKVEGQHNH